MKLNPGSRSPVVAGLVTLALALSAGCGTRLPDAEFADPDTPLTSVGQVVPPMTPAEVSAGEVPRSSRPDRVATSPTASAPAVSNSTRHGAQRPPTAQPASGGKSAGTPVSGVATAPCSKALIPIVLGQTGAFSGVVGSQHGGLRDGVALWVQAVNARGGAQCHPIKMYTLDDGSDPGRAAANWNDLVHDKKAVAIVGTSEPLTAATYRSAAERDRVPIIGGDGVAPEFWISPYMFPQGGEALASYAVAQRYAADTTPGTKKIGLIYCVEAAICTAQKNNFPGSTRAMGYDVGPMQAVSLTQPDYTSECQVMKQAEVKTVWIMVDGSAISRFLRSCATLGYHPRGVTGATAIGNPASADNPQMRENGVFLGAQVAPFIADDTPGLREWHQALRIFAPDLRAGHATMLGWSSGKLFEAALAQVAMPARSGAVSTAVVLAGLWSLTDEKLDGLSPGVTFIKGKASPPNRCSFILGIGPDGWIAPTGSAPQCL